ncbi:hypothetical protein BH23CHL2_BH23CHL2_21730 [soil metagenome]
MGVLDSDLRSHRIIGLDTSLFIYSLENHAVYGELAGSVFIDIEDGQYEAVTSVVSLMEVTVQPLRLGQVDVVRAYQTYLGSFPNLDVVDIDRRTALIAARLRASYRVRPADALQLAACIEAGATAFITNDLRLRQVQEIAVVTLYTYVDSGL